MSIWVIVLTTWHRKSNALVVSKSEKRTEKILLNDLPINNNHNRHLSQLPDLLFMFFSEEVMVLLIQPQFLLCEHSDAVVAVFSLHCSLCNTLFGSQSLS